MHVFTFGYRLPKVFCHVWHHGHLLYFNVNTIISSVKKLRIGKSNGFDGLTSDYILNDSKLLFTVITFLFNCIILHG